MSITLPISTHVIAVTIGVIFIISGLYLGLSDYSRKETVRGYVVPDKGIIKTYPIRTGIIKSLLVKHGDNVAIGQPLATIINPHNLKSGEQLNKKLKNDLLFNLKILDHKISNTQKLSVKHISMLNNKKKGLIKYKKSMENLIGILNAKLQINEDNFKKNKKIFSQGYLSLKDFNTFKNELLSSEYSKEELLESVIKVEDEINQINSDLSIEPLKLKLKIAEIRQGISDLKSKLIEVEDNFQYVIKAKLGGTITAIQLKKGMKVTENKPLLSIIPFNSKFEVLLFIPTRAAGFVKLGNVINIRFDAFPYQKFGFFKAKISKIDKVLTLPEETDFPSFISEPMYVIRATLNKQTINLNGELYPLKVGMFLEADVILDRRSLFNWLVAPLYGIKEQLNNE